MTPAKVPIIAIILITLLVLVALAAGYYTFMRLYRASSLRQLHHTTRREWQAGRR